MFGLDTAKELIEKINKLVKVFETIDLEKIKMNIDDLSKFKEKLNIFKYLFTALLAITILNTVLITIVLLKK